MNTLEMALTFGGLCASVLGIILAAIFKPSKKTIGKYTPVAIICVGILSAIIGFSIYHFNTVEYEHNEITVTITDKNSRYHKYKNRRYRKKNNNCRRDYYFYFDDHKVKVDHTTYNKYDIGDTVVITETITYRLDRKTGEKEIEDISYEEN